MSNQVTLDQLIDEAVGGSECGLVNFNTLQYLLHVLVNKLDLGDVAIEHTGSCKKIQSRKKSAHRGETITANVLGEINNLNRKVDELRNISSNESLIDAARRYSMRDGKSTPVVDMYQILTLSKRIDAAEDGIAKLGSLIEDLARMDNVGGEDQSAPSEVQERKGSSNIDATATDPTASVLEGIVLSQLNHKCAMELIQMELDSLRKIVLGSKNPDDVQVPLSLRISLTDIKITQCVDQLNSLDSVYNDQLSILMGQTSQLEKEIGRIVEKMGDTLDDDGPNPIVLLNDRCNKLDEDVGELVHTQTLLSEDKDLKAIQINSLFQQTELLRFDKIGREEFEEKISEKVDICTVNRKVSFEQFNATCEHLSRGVEATLGKLIEQEELWTNALVDLEEEVGTKLDRTEMEALAEFMNSKMAVLQKKLKTFRMLKKEQEAAITKTRLLRNVQCISCDKDVVMKRHADVRLYRPPPSTPQPRAIAPYLAFELDQLRKQQKWLPTSRNLNHFESALQGNTTVRSKEFINRYCGGDHTVTSPLQRVSRVGHFLEQWGPEINTEPDNLIKGRDGVIYQGTEYPLTRPLKGRATMSVRGGILQKRETSKFAPGCHPKMEAIDVDIPERDFPWDISPKVFKRPDVIDEPISLCESGSQAPGSLASGSIRRAMSTVLTRKESVISSTVNKITKPPADLSRTLSNSSPDQSQQILPIIPTDAESNSPIIDPPETFK